ncbi:ATP/GTP-binding protein [Streptomyces olivaceiscleroticus]|uniref:ATP/GTP-binding protein n=1 Tax=Streptomyces olivaceiscleroticus TaxID=68245 RepID=A0ABP3JIA1_9ACTN
MAGRDLRALFSSNDRSLAASEAFTNRQGQWQAVTDALGEHLRRLTDPAFDVEDLEAPRRNVLVFHGVGGIGKSTLSRKLEAALATGGEQRPAQWPAPAWPTDHRILPVRIDLARSAGMDFERVVLTLRLALAELGRPLPAFDLALRRYWEHTHPGESLEEYLRRDGLAARFGKALPQQMQSALGDVAQALLLPGTVATAVSQVTGALVRSLRERRQTAAALAGCGRLADLLEAEPDLDALSFYPHLLAWELAQLPADKAVVPVVLLDTFEDIGDRTHRDFERLLQRVVWLMPNALFLLTGRSRLQWAEEALAGQLDWTGPAAWPALAIRDLPAARTPSPSAGGRQFLIGDFSPEDCEDYLARRLARNGQPVIDARLRQVITSRSHGLPLYLDLAAMRFLEIRRSGRTPQPADFDADFPALIARTLADLTPDERHVLRSVALLDAFDLNLATRTAGLTHQAPALRLTERPFVRHNPFGLWPFHLHDLIRSTLRTADDQTDDRWSPTDWQQAATRAFEALGEQWSAGETHDRLLLVGCLRQGLRLARDHRLDLGWLTEAAWAYIGDSVWEPLAPPARDHDTGTGLQTAADALVEILSTLARRQRENRSRTAERLTRLIDSGLLPPDLHDMAVYYLAKAQRDLGLTEDSRRGMQHVVAGGGRLAPNARRGLAHLSRLAGDFPTAIDAAAHLGWEGRHHRVTGDVRWVQGDIAGGAQAFQAARREGEEHGKKGEAAMSQAMRAFTLAFADPDVADDEIELAEQLLGPVDLRAATLDVRIAELLRDAGADTGFADRYQVLRAEIDTSGLAFAQAKLELALAFHHAVRDDQEGAAASISRLRALTRQDYYAYYADIAHFMAGLPLPAESASAARWLDGEQATRERWRALVTARREYLRTP